MTRMIIEHSRNDYLSNTYLVCDDAGAALS